MRDTKIAEAKQLYEDISKEFSKVIIGKQDVLKLLVVTLLASGHALIEGVPGIAKTLIAKVFAQTLGLSFKRIQFTPDMIPSDILGLFVYNQKTQEFSFRKGPVFANLILADEINRGTPKVQSSLLEVMQERQVTIEGVTQHVPEPFMVIATQNPVEHEGVYPLPEAQLDRFMCRVMVDYPDHMEGLRILESSPDRESVLAGMKSRVTTADLQEAISTIRSHVHVDKDIMDYIVAVVEATRRDTSRLILGASPRASVQLLESSKVLAAIQGRSYVIPDDVKELCFSLLNHRVILRPDYLIESIQSGDRSAHSRIRKVVDDALTEILPPR